MGSKSRPVGKTLAKLHRRYRVDDPKRFRLKDVDPGDTAGLKSPERADGALERGVDRLEKLQEKLYADGRWSVLLLFQAMDAAGKDSTIDHVLSGVNPAGCHVKSFKVPTTDELDHDWLWRHAKELPARGRIGIFNRSWYEEVLVVRVHPEILTRQKTPPELVKDDVWDERFEDINAFERHLARSGTVVLKFFLHVSKEEQRQRFLARIDDPSKNWKFAVGDVEEREKWDDYMDAYEEMVRRTSTKHAPWHVIPADNKWFTRLAVSAVLVDAISDLDVDFPRSDEKRRRELAEARRRLAAEDESK